MTSTAITDFLVADVIIMLVALVLFFLAPGGRSDEAFGCGCFFGVLMAVGLFLVGLAMSGGIHVRFG